jgi:uncharacterized membrane protein
LQIIAIHLHHSRVVQIPVVSSEEDETTKQVLRLQQRKAIQTLDAAVLPLGLSKSMLFRVKGDKLLDVAILLAYKC